MRHGQWIKSRGGFTLIELMVVVGIIGILLTIGVPNYRKYQAKARQAEVKMALASVYSLEKSFYSEYTAYVPSMTALGYFPEGNKRFYRIGWPGGGTYSHTITNYASADYSNSSYATTNTPVGWFDCTWPGGLATYPDASEPPFDVDNPQTFMVGSIGNISGVSANADCDYWRITDTKLLQNTQVGL